MDIVIGCKNRPNTLISGTMYYGIITIMLALDITATMVQEVCLIVHPVYTRLTPRVAVSPNPLLKVSELIYYRTLQNTYFP
jgi:hypothetical protein